MLLNLGQSPHPSIEALGTLSTLLYSAVWDSLGKVNLVSVLRVRNVMLKVAETPQCIDSASENSLYMNAAVISYTEV